MYIPAASRRPLAFAGLALAITFLLFIGHSHYTDPGISYTPTWGRAQNATAPLELSSGAKRRLAHLRKTCSRPDPFEAQYGRANLRMTRGYEGSLARLERFVHKVVRGEEVKVGVIGGSVTAGHHIRNDEGWPYKLHQFVNEFYKPAKDIPVINGAAPATGSDYYSFCFALHIPKDVDLVFIELGINDVGKEDDLHNMENLLRGLLDLESQPAVVIMDALGYGGGPQGGGGGRYHLPVAQYYDVPFVNQRHALASHFARFPDLVPYYFATSWEGGPDLRHLNARGHHDVKNLIASLLRDTTCNMISDPHFTLPPSASPEPAVLEMPSGSSYDEEVEQLYSPHVQAALKVVESGWAEEERTWNAKYEPKDGEEAAPHKKYYRQPGMWGRPVEHGMVPRIEFMAGWNPDPNYRVGRAQPTCYSTKATDPKFNLTPVEADGWEWWQHPDHNDKPYIMAKEPGARVTFEIETHRGTIKLYYLRSERMSLGKIRCWLDDDEKQGKEGVLINGYWKRDWLNIGDYTTIAEGVSPGTHRVNCINLNETDTADGGHDFRIISIVSS